MNRPTDYQIIEYDGHPLFVVVPYEEFQRIRPLLERENARHTIPQEVVERHVLEEIPLVRAWREHLGLTQSRLASLAGMKQSSIARIERGESRPRRATLEKLARAMGLTPEQLLIEEAEDSSA